MDEKLVEQISTSTGVPQELVSRSAQARAEANGVDINVILKSWSSGEPPSVSSTPVEPMVEETPVETTVEETPVETMVDYIDENIDPPAQLGTKIFRALQFGTVYGIVAGFIQAFIVSSYLYEGLILEAETLNLISNYIPTQYILNIALTTTLFSIINSVNLKKVLERNYEGFGILTNDRESVFLGIGLGLIFGSSVGFLITSNIGVTIEAILEDDVTTHLIPVMGSFWSCLLYTSPSPRDS